MFADRYDPLQDEMVSILTPTDAATNPSGPTWMTSRYERCIARC